MGVSDDISIDGYAYGDLEHDIGAGEEEHWTSWPETSDTYARLHSDGPGQLIQS